MIAVAVALAVVLIFAMVVVILPIFAIWAVLSAVMYSKSSRPTHWPYE